MRTKGRNKKVSSELKNLVLEKGSDLLLCIEDDSQHKACKLFLDGDRFMGLRLGRYHPELLNTTNTRAVLTNRMEGNGEQGKSEETEHELRHIIEDICGDIEPTPVVPIEGDTPLTRETPLNVPYAIVKLSAQNNLACFLSGGGGLEEASSLFRSASEMNDALGRGEASSLFRSASEMNDALGRMKNDDSDNNDKNDKNDNSDSRESNNDNNYSNNNNNKNKDSNNNNNTKSNSNQPGDNNELTSCLYHNQGNICYIEKDYVAAAALYRKAIAAEHCEMRSTLVSTFHESSVLTAGGAGGEDGSSSDKNCNNNGNNDRNNNDSSKSGDNSAGNKNGNNSDSNNSGDNSKKNSGSNNNCDNGHNNVSNNSGNVKSSSTETSRTRFCIDHTKALADTLYQLGSYTEARDLYQSNLMVLPSYTGSIDYNIMNYPRQYANCCIKSNEGNDLERARDTLCSMVQYMDAIPISIPISLVEVKSNNNNNKNNSSSSSNNSNNNSSSSSSSSNNNNNNNKNAIPDAKLNEKDQSFLYSILSQLASLYLKMKLYDDAKCMYVRALPSGKADIFDSLVKIELISGNITEAMKMNEKILKKREKKFGPSHPATIHAVCTYAEMYEKSNNLGDALRFYHRAYAVYEAELGCDNYLTLMVASGLGRVYEKVKGGEKGEKGGEKGEKGEKDETTKEGKNKGDEEIKGDDMGESHVHAERWFVEAIRGFKIALGDDHAHTLTCLRSLANIYKKQNRFEDTERLLIQLLQSNDRTKGMNNLDSLRLVSSIAIMLKKQGKYRDSECMYTRAFHGYCDLYGMDNKEVLTTLNNLGLLYKAMDRFDLARDSYNMAFAGRVKLLGYEHQETLATVSNIAVLLSDQGNYGDALVLYQNMLAGFVKRFGSDHMESKRARNNILILKRKQSNPPPVSNPPPLLNPPPLVPPLGVTQPPPITQTSEPEPILDTGSVIPAENLIKNQVAPKGATLVPSVMQRIENEGNDDSGSGAQKRDSRPGEMEANIDNRKRTKHN